MKLLAVLVIVLIVVIGIDVSLNDGAITRDALDALARFADQVVRAVDSMVSSMIGRR